MKTLAYLLIPALLINAVPVLAADSDRLIRRANRYFAPLPAAMPGSENDNPQKIELGKKLFFDNRLSINDAQSCASCHRLENGFAGMDNLATSPGAKGQQGTRNSPSVLNAGFQRLQFWDGRALSLQEQAKGPILNPVEMAMPDEQTLERKIQSIEEYQKAFQHAFPEEKQAITFHNITEAIAAFERTLISPSRFDDFLRGDAQALSQDEQAGLKTFIKADCTSCHDGVLIGGDSLEKLGKKQAYANQSDQGLFAITKDEPDRMVFKVSQLRNIALTAPYFHDGTVTSLEEAVRLMGKLQLDNELSDQDVKEIVSFLNSLTDKNYNK
ncbi:MAG: c-type cytochrome [Gammaproteobacteria bacterium]|nr:c-type cytochrome [Gammaproteobacteria bacterium]